MKWQTRVGIYLMAFGFILIPNRGTFDPGMIGFWLLGITVGYDMHKIHQEKKK